ncbi:MAG: glycosyltransferase family 4 protein, partial [Actinomycetota bacterium]|nr:glycosyltransferase family 4 protein [Actinomycetota bacterium]
PTGTGVYLRALCGALRELDVDLVTACNRRRRPPAGGGAGSWANLAGDRWWTQVELPRRARGVGADVLHHPLPAHSTAASCAQVVTVHDLGYERLPDCFDPRFRAFARLAYPRAARRADAVVCVSETTSRDVAARWALAGDRVVVAPHGPGQETVAAPADRGAYLLYVGDEEPRKNLPLLLAGYRLYREAAAAPVDLVLAGSAAARGPGISLVPSPNREGLASLYAGATALVAASLHEGFGLTALEAMTAGTPVLAARTGAHVEVCGDAARYFDPRDPVDLARAIGELAAASDGERSELVGGGRSRVAGYSWERSARAHLAAYTLAVSHRRSH